MHPRLLRTATVLLALLPTVPPAAGGVPPARVVDLVVPAPAAGEVVVPLPLPEGPGALLLEPHSLRSPRFALRSGARSSALQTLPAAPPRTYRGVLVRPGRADAKAAATLDGSSLSAVVVEPDRTLLSIQPLGAPVPGAAARRHVVVRSTEVDATGGTCGTAAPPAGERTFLPASASAPRVLELALDLDVELLGKNGGSVAAALTDVETVLNAAELILEAQAGLTFEVHAAVVRTAEPDPFGASDAATLLAELQAEWNGPLVGVPRDVVHLFTGRDLAGPTIGFANVGVACLAPYAFSLSQTRYTTNLLLRTALTAHELAHNLNATHCAGTDCRIMCASIGGCTGDVTQFGAAAQGELAAFVQGAPCLVSTAAPHALPFLETVPTPTLDAARWATAAGAAVAPASGGAATAPFSVRLAAASGAPAGQATLESVPLALGTLSAAELTVAVRADGAGGSDALVLELSSATGGWLELLKVQGAGASFQEHSAAVPAGALHDGARLRVRTDANAAGDAFLIDDVRVGPPLSAPTIATVHPPAVATLAGGKVSVVGGGFAGANLTVLVSGAPVAPELVTVADDQHVTFVAPVAPSLGSVPVQVKTAGGTSAPAALTFEPPSPPVLVGPGLVLNGWNLNLQLAGPPGGPAWLLVNATGSAIPYGAGSLLSPAVLLKLAPLDGLGLGLLSAPIAGIPAGTSFSLQLVTAHPPGTDPGTLEVSTILTAVVLF